MPDTESLFDVEIQVGTVLSAEPFPEADKPALAKLTIDLGGPEPVTSIAQTEYNYDCADLVDRQVLCATNLGSVRIAGVKSEALTVGVPDEEGHPVLVGPDSEVPVGGSLY